MPGVKRPELQTGQSRTSVIEVTSGFRYALGQYSFVSPHGAMPNFSLKFPKLLERADYIHLDLSHNFCIL